MMIDFFINFETKICYQKGCKLKLSQRKAFVYLRIVRVMQPMPKHSQPSV